MNQSPTADLSGVQSPTDSVTPRRARVAAALSFLVGGTIFGTWATLIPSFKSRFALSEAELGTARIAIVVGAIASIPVAGQSIARHSSRQIVRRLPHRRPLVRIHRHPGERPAGGSTIT